jgi:hypothetical protein
MQSTPHTPHCRSKTNQALLLAELLAPERCPEGLISKQPLTEAAKAQTVTGNSSTQADLEQAAREVRAQGPGSRLLYFQCAQAVSGPQPLGPQPFSECAGVVETVW